MNNDNDENYHHDFIFKDLFKVAGPHCNTLIFCLLEALKVKFFCNHSVCNSRCHDLQTADYLNFKQNFNHEIICLNKVSAMPVAFNKQT